MSYRDVQPPGFEITPELKTWESRRKCPRCNYELYTGEKRGIRIEACGWCGGIFLENEHAKRAFAEQSRAPEELAAKVEKATRAVVIDDQNKLLCPECETEMVRRDLGPARVDICDPHGTWFDRSELGTAMRAMRGESEYVKNSIEEKFLREQDLRKKPFGPQLDYVKTVLGDVLDAIFK